MRRFWFALVLICPVPARAWVAWGHQVVAKIAYDNSSPAVREWVETVLSRMPDPGFRTLAEASAWPDTVRRQRPETGTWHYINLPIKSGLSDALDPHNVVWAIPEMEKRVIKETGAEQAEDLAFLIHLVGDVHQPLHTASLRNADYPTGDAGGNRIHVSHRLGGNLHAFWDRAGGRRRQDPDRFAKKLEHRYPAQSLGQALSIQSPAAWARESHNLAEGAYKELDWQRLPDLSDAYVKHSRSVAERQLALGGYRLRNVLTRVWAASLRRQRG
jgi:hypothetical protein